MFDRILAYLEQTSGDDDGSHFFTIQDGQLAYTSLLCSLIPADGYIRQSELLILRQIITDRFEVTPKELNDLIDRGMQKSHDTPGIYSYAFIINKACFINLKQQIIADLWEIAQADGEIHPLEVELVTRISSLLGQSCCSNVPKRRYAAGDLAFTVDNKSCSSA